MLPTLNCAGTSVLSREWFYLWNQALHAWANFAVIHALWSMTSRFERVYFRYAVRHSWRKKTTGRSTSTWSSCWACAPDDALSGHILRPLCASSLALSLPTTQQTSPNQAHPWTWLPRDISGACLCCSIVLCFIKGTFLCRAFLCSLGNCVSAYLNQCTGRSSR